MTKADSADDLVPLTNTSAQTESLQISLKQTEFICWRIYLHFKRQNRLKVIDQFTHLTNNISCQHTYRKGENCFDSLSIIGTSDLTDKKLDFF